MVAGVSAVVIAFLAAWFVLRNPALRCLNEIEVAGYVELTHTGDVTSAGPWAEALFVGPAADDVFGLITAPGLSLRPPRMASAESTPDEPDATSRRIAYGDAPDSCHVSVRNVTPRSYDEEDLTEGQISGMRDGSVHVLSIRVTCGDG
jgi:hypothetical protein